MNCHIQIRPGMEYAPETRLWNGCPTVAVTGKRIWSGLFTGGKFETSRHNYVVMMCSDDGGETWVDPYMVVTYREEDCLRTMDGNFGYDPKGRLWFFSGQGCLSLQTFVSPIMMRHTTNGCWNTLMVTSKPGVCTVKIPKRMSQYGRNLAPCSPMR